MQVHHKPSHLNQSSSSSRLLTLILISSSLCTIFLTVNLLLILQLKSTTTSYSIGDVHSPTTIIVFGIASSMNSWPHRRHQVLRWWKPNQTRGCIFLDQYESLTESNPETSPPICISSDTSNFRYTFRNGIRSAIRVARVISETISLNHSDVRWFVFGDDDETASDPQLPSPKSICFRWKCVTKPVGWAAWVMGRSDPARPAQPSLWVESCGFNSWVGLGIISYFKYKLYEKI
ncbi:hypothetical protein QQ045_002256 [Rhodiola kirilowii]